MEILWSEMWEIRKRSAHGYSQEAYAKMKLLNAEAEILSKELDTHEVGDVVQRAMK